MKISKRYSFLFLILACYFIILILYFSKIYTQSNDIKANWGTFGDFIGGSLSPIIGLVSIVLTYRIINNQILQDKQTEFKYMFEILFTAIPQKKEYIALRKLKGNEALKKINKDIESVYSKLHQEQLSAGPGSNINEAWASVYKDIGGSSGPFMKNLHNCLKIIDKHCVGIHKKVYADLLRAQLSEEELIFIFYNGIAHQDFGGFKDRIERYSVLKDVANYDFDDQLRALYSAEAFEDTPDDFIKVFSVFKKNFKIELNFSRN